MNDIILFLLILWFNLNRTVTIINITIIINIDKNTIEYIHSNDQPNITYDTANAIPVISSNIG